MPTRISDAIGVSAAALERAGAFNAFVDFDSRLYVDPSLLRQASIPELKGAYRRFQRHFANVLHLLRASKKPNDVFLRTAVEKLTFHETPYIRLGYGRSKRPGSGIGHGLAGRLTSTAKEIQEAGISDPVVFELVGLIEEDIGADRISDMAISIVLPDLLAYSHRLAAELGTAKRRVLYRDEVYRIPRDRETGEGVALVPRELLRDLPVAEDWSDIDIVAADNAALRERVNSVIGKTWRSAIVRPPKWMLRRAPLLENPELLRDLIHQYKAKDPEPYDFENDPAGEIGWYDTAASFATQHPLALATVSKGTSGLVAVVRQICDQYKRLIEVNGLDIHLYGENGKRRHERYAQRLFYGVADSYCRANDLDLSPEANAGSGPVDFKFSRGSSAKMHVEVKYSTNSKLVSGYTKQLPRYNDAEDTEHSIYLVIQVSNSDAAIKRVQKLHAEARRGGKRAPDVVVVDGRLKRSASKL